jgi:gliding motility-associated-like protein
MQKLITFLALLFIPAIGATHIVGGEMYYDCLGNNQYRFTLKLYRDCLQGQAPYDNPATFSLWGVQGNLIQNLMVNFPGAIKVPFVSGNPCYQQPPNACVEEAIYSVIVTLPNVFSPVTMAYQRCCRNNTILNLIDPQSTGSTYTTTVPGTNVVNCNSSPRFNQFPPIAICLGDTLNFDHSATDPDGDSLVYTLCATYSGATVVDPMPSPTSPPPYSPIVFAPPYSAAYPIATNPPININSQTGLLQVAPSQPGQYVVGVCVNEYRNGILLGTHQRDFQFNVGPCASNVTAGMALNTSFIPDPNGIPEICGFNNIQFLNLSSGATYFLWDFGIPGTTTDTSTLFQPSFNYPAQGTFTITLVANPGYFCADTTQQTITVYQPPVSLQLLSPAPQCINDNSFNFGLAVSPDSSGNFTWNFGPLANPNNAQGNYISGVSYQTPGNYPFTVIHQLGPCIDTLSGVAILFGIPEIFPPPPVVGCEIFTHTLIPTIEAQNNPLLFFWDLGNGNTSTDTFPTSSYTSGVYTPILNVISLGCSDTLTFTLTQNITVNPSPISSFTVNPDNQSIFNAFFQFNNTSQSTTLCTLYTGDGFFSGNCNLIYEYLAPGEYTAAQIVWNEYGCSDTAFLNITVLPEFTFYIPNTFTPTGDNVNDGFRGYGIGIDRYRLEIFDRWGGSLFTSENLYETWDGKHYLTGVDIHPGIYVWKVTLKDIFGRNHQYFGKVLLVRKSGLGF